MKILRGLRVFEYTLWQKAKTAESFLNKILLNLLNPCGAQNNISLNEIKCVIYFCFVFYLSNNYVFIFKGTLMQIWESPNTFKFI